MKKKKLNSKNPKYKKKDEEKNVTKTLVQITANGTKIYTINKN
jgi:hypothetical protein